MYFEIIQISNFDILQQLDVSGYERQFIFNLNHYTRNYAYEAQTWLVGLCTALDTIYMVVRTFPGAFIKNLCSGALSKVRLAH